MGHCCALNSGFKDPVKSLERTRRGSGSGCNALVATGRRGRIPDYLGSTWILVLRQKVREAEAQAVAAVEEKIQAEAEHEKWHTTSLKVFDFVGFSGDVVVHLSLKSARNTMGTRGTPE